MAGETKHGGTIELDGIRLFVRERGDGRALLLINGLGSNADMWGAVEERLSGRARTVAYDLPGSGRSPTAQRPHTISGLASLSAALLDRLGHAEADVLGFSLGGLVAQQFARDFPERVRRLALVGTACGWGSMPPTYEAMALLALPVRYHSPTLYRKTNRLLGAADRELLARLATLTESRLRHPPPLLGYTFQLSAGSVWSSLSWLDSVQVPTLVLAGDDDQVVPSANGVQLTRLLPESRLHILRDGGHLCVFDPDGPALPLLEDFFTAPEHTASEAWLGGASIEDDAAVEAAFAASPGAFPHRLFSDAYRRLVRPALAR